MLRAAGSFDPSTGPTRFRAHDTWHGHVGIHLRHMKQSLNLQIHNALILVDICNLEDILFVPCLDAKILVAFTRQSLCGAKEPKILARKFFSLSHRECRFVAYVVVF